MRHLVDSEGMPASEELEECSSLIKKVKITEDQERDLKAVAIKICKNASAIYKEGLAKGSTEFNLKAESKIILKQNSLYEKALDLYLIAQQWAEIMPLKSDRRAKLLAQINENIGKFKALITARRIFFEVLTANDDQYPHNLLAATFIANWSKIVLTRTEILPVDMSSSGSEYLIKSSKHIIYEFLMNYPLHECNLLKLDDREDPETSLEVSGIVNTFIIKYRYSCFFSSIPLLPIIQESEPQSSLNLS